MDLADSLLAGPRAQRAFLLRVCMARPWALQLEDRAPLALVIPVRGRLVYWFPDGERGRVEVGQVAVFAGGDDYLVGDDFASPVTAVIDEDQECHSPAGESLREVMGLGVRTWGSRLDGPDEMITAVYTGANEISAPLLAALPRVLVVDGEDLEWPLVDLLQREVTHDGPGQGVVLDRMLDLLLMGVLRSWIADQDSAAPDWARTCPDPVVRVALGAIHHNPEQAWTVASLAAFAGVSRAALARRFVEATGTTPMSYLTHWRVALAADLILEGGTLESIARRVGYASAFGLSAAFKRIRGVSPQEFRRDSRTITGPVSAG